MYDITNKETFESIHEWIANVKEIKGENFPMILLGNKIDLEDNREVSKESGEDLAYENHIEFFETSNKDGINIKESIMALVNKIVKSKNFKKNDLTISILSENHSSSSFKKKQCC